MSDRTLRLLLSKRHVLCIEFLLQMNVSCLLFEWTVSLWPIFFLVDSQSCGSELCEMIVLLTHLHS